MFEIGQVFNKNGFNYCVLDIIEYNGVTYILFSRESNIIDYIFYEVYKTDTGYNLIELKDEKISFALLDIFERKETSEE